MSLGEHIQAHWPVGKIGGAMVRPRHGNLTIISATARAELRTRGRRPAPGCVAVPLFTTRTRARRAARGA